MALKSLILGDELCSEQKVFSALSIIGSGLYSLCKRRSSFIFTSHLHQLTTLEEVKSLKESKVYHLKIDYDKEKDILIYDRKLEEGSGPSIYGLKVCEAMGLSTELFHLRNKFKINWRIMKQLRSSHSIIQMYLWMNVNMSYKRYSIGNASY